MNDAVARTPEVLSEKEVRAFFIKMGEYYPDRERKIESPLKNGRFLASFKRFESNDITSVWKADINNDELMD